MHHPRLKDQFSVDSLNKCRDLLAHRGPDHAGHFSDDQWYLGHRRLSIIDLSPEANQPMLSEDENFMLVFNGEIYNYRELGRKYPEIRSSSDSRTLLSGYMRFGKEFLKEIRGIYSFAILDRSNGSRLIMMRDPFGVKPLYFSWKDGVLAFSSEIKSLLPIVSSEIHYDALLAYFHLGYIIEPDTVYTSIKSIDPGFCYEYVVEREELIRTRIFDFQFGADRPDQKSDTIKHSEELLKVAVKRSLISDVGFHIALSGGIDSSLVLAFAQEFSSSSVEGINVKFADHEYDESEVAKAISAHLNTKLNTFPVESDIGNVEVLENILTHFDQPYADSSLIPFYLLSRVCSKSSKVLIGGDGGDELFGGYLGLYSLVLQSRFPRRLSLLGSSFLSGALPHPELSRKFNRIKGIMAFEQDFLKWVEWQSWVSLHEEIYKDNEVSQKRNEYLEKVGERLGYANLPAEVLFQDAYTKVRLRSDYLRKTDMMSMLNSLEYRVPFLDEDLAKYAVRIPFSEKASFSKKKKILRSIHSKIYPKSISNLPKSGFSIPVDQWLSEKDFDDIHMRIQDGDNVLNEFLKKDYIDNLFLQLKNRNQKMISRASVYQRILILFSTLCWFEKTRLNANIKM